MKLTKQQLLQIECKLEDNGINFDDVKIELTDHIASDIEENEDLKNLHFDDALKISLKKWEDSFKPVKSFLAGENKYPQIVISSVYKAIKMQFYVSALAVILSVLLFVLLCKDLDSVYLITQFKTGMRVICVLSFFWLLVFKFWLFEKKFKTIFSHFALMRIVVFISFLFPMLNSNTPTTLRNQIGFLILGTIIICHFLFTSYYAYKHLKIQKHYA